MNKNIIVKNNALKVNERIGDVQLREDMFTEEQRSVFEDVLQICDKNPILQWQRGNNNHNLDFCLIEGKIEPVKNFCQKVIFKAGLSMKSHEPIVTKGDNGNQFITVGVTLYKNEREITCNGGSSLHECRYPKNKRAFHDAVARAQTRGMKIAIESFMGFGFVNLIIQKVFGGFGINDKPENPADHGAPVQPRCVNQPNKKCKEIYDRIRKALVSAYRQKLITAVEGKTWQARIDKSSTKEILLADFEVAINQLINQRKKKK